MKFYAAVLLLLAQLHLSAQSSGSAQPSLSAQSARLAPSVAPILSLWYDKPATIWEETLPLGNGRLGMMPDGGIQQENIVLNDITLWSGSPQDANNYEAHTVLPRIRQLLLEGKNDSAQTLVDQSFICKGQGSGGVPYGCYQVLGNLHLQFTYDGPAPTMAAPATSALTTPVPDHYERQLSLNDAVARCTYRVNGVIYKREYFTSFGDDVDVIRITADHPGQLNCSVSIDRPERSATTVSGTELQLSGQLDNGTDGKGMQYLSRVKCRLKGGTLSTNTLSTGEKSLVIKNATEIILFVSASTDWKGAPFRELSAKNLATAFNRPYAEQLRLHVAAYQKLFNRLSLAIGPGPATTPTSPAPATSSATSSPATSSPATTPSAAPSAAPAATLPTDQRLIHYHQDPTGDNGFPVLFFQFGRYLNIASTRVGLLPPNLQGLWANQIHTPWNGDYHLDINIQMNQWPVEAANLSELNLPLADLVAGMVPEGEKTAKAYYNADGWVAHVITNIWGFTEPGESASWGVCKVGGGWLCDNLWQHYAFTGDLAYLRKIYPILKGSAEFYNSMLIEDPDNGWLVTAPSSSPENSFLLPNGHSASICMGPTIDNQIIRELFDNVITASKQLGIDAPFSATLAERLQHLPPPGVVGPDGRLMEWLKPYPETEPHHRHISHLYGLYPASLITPESTPALAEACRKTLEARGDDGPSWSIAYKILWWARLHDGNRAGKLLNELLNPTIKKDMNYGAGGGIYPDLLSAGPPFQIDGNYGAEAGIAEMLIQSHAGYIELLPAIPEAWKPSGSVAGLKARGNFTVDFQWKDGRVTEYRITSPAISTIKVKVNGEIKEISSGPVVHHTAPPLPYTNYFSLRNGLKHTYAAITKNKKLTVAFLGGSITYNPGWRDKVCTWLKARYPQTDFHFIAAGIPSLGSVPHAFRLQQDVLDSGRVDLLFLEAAVNDRGNGTDSLSQLRALEGIVRHARHSNPDMDIVLMAFADPDKTKDYDNGKVPVEIANQELIATHYNLPSINIAKEVHDKIRHGEFSWEKDFKDIHPAPFGQQLYFDNIKALFTAQSPAAPALCPLPPPLDEASLENGRYVAVDAAHHDTAWTLDKDWTPADKADTRPGFVHVPVLESTAPGAELSLSFNGTAVGIAVVSGPDAGIIGYSIDDSPFQPLNLYTRWSDWLHLPWYLLLGSGLTAGPHVLHLRISSEKDPQSKGHACRIVHFLVNQDSPSSNADHSSSNADHSSSNADHSATTAEMARFMAQRFGLFLHFGPITLRGTEIGWSRNKEVAQADYDSLYKEFNPALFNADTWVATAKAAGMKYLTIVAKHHDGFCEWPTAYSSYNIKNAPFKRDLVGELARACKKQGLIFCVYFTVLDWHDADYPIHNPYDSSRNVAGDMPRFKRRMKDELHEIITRYHPFMLWFDGYWERPWTAADGKEIYQYIKSVDAHVIINNRLGKDLSTLSGAESVGDFLTPEQRIGQLNMIEPWESCITICSQWAWKPADSMKSLKECIHTLAKTAGGNGNLLFNVGPMMDGRMEARQVKRLLEIGGWLKKYGESIYGTNGGPYPPNEIYTTTRKGKKIYLHVFARPSDVLTLPPLPGVRVEKASWLGGSTLTVTQDEKTGYSLHLPDRLPDENCSVIVLELNKNTADLPVTPVQK